MPSQTSSPKTCGCFHNNNLLLYLHCVKTFLKACFRCQDQNSKQVFGNYSEGIEISRALVQYKFEGVRHKEVRLIIYLCQSVTLSYKQTYSRQSVLCK